MIGRAGSKGYPGKNIINLNGRKLCEYPLIAVKKSKLIDEMYPSWIQKTYKRYCNPTDMKNWATVCKTVKTTPKKIIVVDFIYFDKEKYSNILLFADLLSSAGFSIVDKYRVKDCEKHDDCLLTVQ